MNTKPVRRRFLPVNSVIVRFAAVMLIVLALPFSIVLIFTTDRLSRMEKESANRFLSGNLRTLSSALDEALANLERLHVFIFMDKEFLNGIKRLAPYNSREEYGDYFNTNGIKNRINNVAITSNYIHSIYAYSFTARRIFSSKVNWDAAFNHFYGAPWLDTYRENFSQDSGRFLRTIPWYFTRDITDGRSILASYREVWANNQPIGLVSINVDTAEIARKLRAVNPRKTGYTCIIDNRGNIIREAETAGTEDVDGALFSFMVPKIPEDSGQGFFNFPYRGKEIFVSYYTSPYSGFRFAAAAPLDQIRTSTPVMTRLIMLFFLLLVLLIIVTMLLARYYFWTPVRALFAGMRQVEEGNFSARLPPDSSYEFGYINDNFNRMTDNIRKLIEENYASKLVSKEAQLKNIQNQLNEHFLYNTLDSIHWLARKENARQVSDMVFSLANFYRISLSSGRDVIPVREAAEMIRNYLFIQQFRIGDAISYAIDCEEDLAEEEIPKGLIQPLVENALTHGLKSLDRPGKVRVCFAKTGDGRAMRVLVEDNGRGFGAEKLRQVREQLEKTESYQDQSFALKTIQSQLRLYYNVTNAVHIETAPEAGARIWFEVPLNTKTSLAGTA
ncbi:MAG: sensor histidine kinase [Treponema sp.]|jgi:two-component system sensor histidine kinase YesM|nr:sensor histidine kinase [Treponema sp.]